MKNGKIPTRKQRQIIIDHGLKPENWLVVKDCADGLLIVSRAALKKYGSNAKTKALQEKEK